MALLFMEGYDDGLTLSRGWSGSWNNNAPSYTTGRFGGSALSQAYLSGATRFITPAITGTGILGAAIKPGQLNGTINILSFGLARLILVAGGALQLARSDNGAQIAVTSSPVWLTANVWRYIELKFNPTTGAVTVKVDGVVALTGTLPVSANIGSLTFHDLPNGYGIVSDDVYMLDITGTKNNDFLGDVRVQLLLPNADGSNTAMTPSSGTAHYSLVNEASPNTTNYVSSAVAGTKDSYQFQDLAATTAKVYGVEVTNYAHKDATGNVSIANMAKVAGTEYLSAAKGLSASWTANIDTLETNPATGQPWAPADVNSAEFGIQVS